MINFLMMALKDMRTKYILILLILFGGQLTLFAQEETGDQVKSVEIRVVEDYKAQVRSAHKISEQPSFEDTTSAKLSVNVRIQPKAMILDFTPEPIPSIRLGRVKLPKLPTQKASVKPAGCGGVVKKLSQPTWTPLDAGRATCTR